MSTAVHQLRASYASVERNFNLIKRYWTWELVWLVYSTADCMAVSFIGLGMQKISGSEGLNTSYLVLYLLVGTLVWRFLSVIFYWITDVISIERWEGTIEYTLMAPIHRITHMAGQTFFAVLYSMVFNMAILVVAVLLFDIDLSNANLAAGAIMLLAGSLSFIGVGISDDSHPSWGKMLQDTRAQWQAAWWLSVMPGAAISAAVLSFNLFGDALRDILDPRLRSS